MYCTRCGAELAASAQICPQCGMPRQPMMSSLSPSSSLAASQLQQPLPAVPSMQASPSAPSIMPMVAQTASPYLPSGVPSWPTTATQPPFVPHPSLGSVSASHVYPQEGKRAERAARPALSVRGVLIGLAFLILVPLIGAAITYGLLYLNGQVQAHTPQKSVAISQLPTAQPTTGTGSAVTPTPATTGNLPTPAKFDTMSSSSQKMLGITITYPDGWQEQPSAPQSDGSVVVDFHPTQQLGIVMFIGRFPATSGTTTDVNQGQIQGLSNLNGVSNVQPVQTASPQRSIGGQQWDEQDATFSASNATFQVASITVKHANYFYNIFYWSPNTYFGEAVQKYMQPMLNSFKFLS